MPPMRKWFTKMDKKNVGYDKLLYSEQEMYLHVCMYIERTLDGVEIVSRILVAKADQ